MNDIQIKGPFVLHHGTVLSIFHQVGLLQLGYR